MSDAVQQPEQARRFAVPWDITEWIDRSALLRGIVEDIDGLDWTNPALIEVLKANPAFQPRFLLVLMTYAYSMGICESEEVAEVHYDHAELRSLFPDPPPSAKAITRFRRDHRGLLRWAVNQALKRALRTHFELGDAAIPAGLKRVLLDAATGRLDLGRHLDRSVQAE